MKKTIFSGKARESYSRLIFQRFRRNSPQPRFVSPRADQAFIPSVAFLLGVATFTLGHKTLGREMGIQDANWWPNKPQKVDLDLQNLARFCIMFWTT